MPRVKKKNNLTKLKNLSKKSSSTNQMVEKEERELKEIISRKGKKTFSELERIVELARRVIKNKKVARKVERKFKDE
jgi:hypothetical protein